MSEGYGDNPQGAESGTDNSGEMPSTAEVNDSTLSSQMQENINKMTELVAELQQEKLKVEGLQLEKLALEEETNNQEVIQKDPIQQLERLVSQMTLLNEERESILLLLQEEMCNYATIQAKFKEHEQSMEVIVKELQQQIYDLEKEREDLKEGLVVKEIAGMDEVEELDSELDDMSKELNDLNNQVAKLTEATICPICMDPWEPEGSHRVVTLRCGHLFGSSCLRQYIERSRQCPVCRKKAFSNEVRNIYYGST